MFFRYVIVSVLVLYLVVSFGERFLFGVLFAYVWLSPLVVRSLSFGFRSYHSSFLVWRVRRSSYFRRDRARFVLLFSCSFRLRSTGC